MEKIHFSGHNVTHQFLTVPEKLAEFKEFLAKEVNLEVSKFESHIRWPKFVQAQKPSSDSVEKIASAPVAISAETKVNCGAGVPTAPEIPESDIFEKAPSAPLAVEARANCGAGVPETSSEMNTSSPTSQLATVFHQPAHTSPHVSVAEVATTTDDENPVDYAALEARLPVVPQSRPAIYSVVVDEPRNERELTPAG